MNNKWITDRRPTGADANEFGRVWNSKGRCVMYGDVAHWEPWMPIVPPEPYKKPKQYVSSKYGNEWGVFRKTNVADKVILGICASNIPTREAAERIAAIYEEMMP